MKSIWSFFLLLVLALPSIGEVISYSGGNPMLGRSKARSAAIPSHDEATQARDFTPVEGPNLKFRLESATKFGVANSREGFWIGYSFELRPRTAVEVTDTSPDGSSTFFPWLLNIKEPNNGYANTNAGVFLRFDAEGKIVRETRVYNTDLQHSFQGLPVYWLGKADSDESLDLLQGFISAAENQQARVSLVDAIGLHAASRVTAILKDLLRTSPDNDVRGSAARWLASSPQARSAVSDQRNKRSSSNRAAAPAALNTDNQRVETDEQSKREYFNRAAQIVLNSDDADTPYKLRRIYRNAKDSALKEKIILQVYQRRSDRQWLDLLIDMAGDEYDPVYKKLVLSYVVKVIGERGSPRLGTSVAKHDDKNLSEQDVRALRSMPTDVAIPRLIDIARRHVNQQLRNAAFEELSNIPDNRVVVFFYEMLSR